ncbi:Stress induced protein [Heracleum sosnowskyi]|uniref:Stress induced protein n=1 Tax=Heracleum sosnowskyi TaxID=360622 RepID=A0AAD8INZ9_9APIA|nr:Stress induced protein [Heracleum sosnowskyi]
MMSSDDQTTRINERDQQEYINTYGYDEEETVSTSRFSCFGFCFNNRGWTLLHGQQREESWLIKKAKKVKEFTEVVAGPKWKNFIRKLGKYTKKSRIAECRQYDPHSYALNFDDGLDDFQQENDNALPAAGFSTKL